MKLVRAGYEIIEQKPGLQGIYDIIERCGKTSYKSEVKGGDVAEKFVNARSKEGHGAVLEFGTVYMKVMLGSPMYDEEYLEKSRTIRFYQHNPYSRVVERQESMKTDEGIKVGVSVAYITTNYRVLVDNNRLDDLQYMCDEPTEWHKRRYSVKFISDLGLARDFLRHRVMSMVQESTRYINYNRERFGNECSFIIPPWITPEELPEGENITWWDGDWVEMDNMKIVYHNPEGGKTPDRISSWLWAMDMADMSYKKGWG